MKIVNYRSLRRNARLGGRFSQLFYLAVTLVVLFTFSVTPVFAVDSFAADTTADTTAQSSASVLAQPIEITGTALRSQKSASTAASTGAVSAPDNTVQAPGVPAKLIEITLGFEPNNGNISAADKSAKQVFFGKKYGEMPIPQRTNYTFAGWYTQKSGGARIMENDRVKTRIDLTLYAHWKLNTILGKADGLPILMYHWFYDAAAGGKSINGNWLEINAFEQQIRYLKQEHYAFPSWHEVEAYITKQMLLPEKSVVITDDDGNDSFFTLAYPIIVQYDVDVTAFLITSVKGTDTIKKYDFDGVRYRSHSHNMHRRGAEDRGMLMYYSRSEAITDLTSSAAILGAKQVLAYPFGHFSKEVEETVRQAGYSMAVTTVHRLAYPGDRLTALPRVRVSEGESLNVYAQNLNGKFNK